MHVQSSEFPFFFFCGKREWIISTNTIVWFDSLPSTKKNSHSWNQWEKRTWSLPNHSMIWLLTIYKEWGDSEFPFSRCVGRENEFSTSTIVWLDSLMRFRIPVTLKQTKDSSSIDVGVSPDIARCRPPLKKPSKAAKCLLFDSGMSSYSFIMLVNMYLHFIKQS